MADVTMIHEVRLETFERKGNRFQQTNAETYFYRDFSFLFPVVYEQIGTVIFNVSEIARVMGITEPLFVSSDLFWKEIFNRKQDPIKNTQILCHAFLSAIDCDTKDYCILEFPVSGNESSPYHARALQRGLKDKSILIERVTR